jgi:hypothetical protein
MSWKKLLAYITGSVDQELLLCNEYLVTENRLLRKQISVRVRLNDRERKTLAEIGKRLGKQALAVVAHRLGLPSTLFLDFVVGRARRGELCVAEAQRIVQAISTRYPQGFVPHSLALLGRLTP